MLLSVPYLKWRGGRPRWEPGATLRAKGWKGLDLKTSAGEWLDEAAAIAAARAINAEVEAARAAGVEAPRRAPRKAKPARSTRALYEAWIDSPEFSRLTPKTRADYAQKAAIFLLDFGDARVEAISRAVLKGYWRRLYKERGHAMANGILAVARAMLTHATDLEWLTTNPAFDLKLPGLEPRVAFWSPAKVAAFVAIADEIGEPEVADALIIALHSGQRQGDVLAMPPRIFEDQRLALSQFKRGALVDAPMTPALLARAAAIRARWTAAGVAQHATMVVDPRHGGPFRDRSAFGRAFRAVRAATLSRYPELDIAERFQPGLSELTFQDLRDTAVTRLAMADCTLPQIAAITGHSPEHVTSVVQHYLALNSAIADAAIGKLSRWLDAQGIAL